MVASALAIYAAGTGAGLLAVGCSGFVLLLVSLAVRWPPGIPSSITVLGAEYVVALHLHRRTLDPAVALYGSGLLLAAELAYWSLSAQPRMEASEKALIRRVLRMSVIVTASTVLALLALLAVQLAPAPRPGLPITILGIVAANVLLLTVAVLAWRGRASQGIR